MDAQSRVRLAAGILHNARRAGSLLDGIPVDLRPTTEGQGYDIQEALVAQMDGRRAGWKISATSERAQHRLGVRGPFSGWITDAMILRSPTVYDGKLLRHIGAEAEYSVTLKAMPAPPNSIEALLPFIENVRLSIEICSVGFNDSLGQGAPTHIADNAASGLLVLGDPLKSWARQDLVERMAVLRVNGEERARGTGKSVMGDPLRALVWLLQDRFARGHLVEQGFVVATGTCTPMTPVHSGDRVEAEFVGLGAVHITL